ncbi:MAG TPA: DUF4439 domain-containing protein [Propionibacteriaceae bacterium]|nr:DUF4439 domain-containing protein [Propionibacteriaceae bacterium]
MSGTPVSPGSGWGGHPSGSALSRRRLLGLGAALPVLAGCTLSTPTMSDATRTPSPAGTTPVPSPSPSASRTPSEPPVVAGAEAAATTELALADLAGAILAGPRRRELSVDQRALLRFVADAHRNHAAALDASVRAPRPADVAPLTLRQSLVRLARAEAAAAGRHRAAALGVSGDDSLRFGSVAAAADLYARVVTADRRVRTSAGPRTPPVLARSTDTVAVQSLVAQLHALVYGYQLAIGRMPVAGEQDDQAVDELRSHRIRRDRLIGWLRRREAEVPVPEPAYRPSVDVRDGATGVRLVRTMLVALQPFAGIWLASAADAEREWALSFFGTTVGLAHGWGAPLPVWPGSAG